MSSVELFENNLSRNNFERDLLDSVYLGCQTYVKKDDSI
jgi:hypothetical protein